MRFAKFIATAAISAAALAGASAPAFAGTHPGNSQGDSWQRDNDGHGGDHGCRVHEPQYFTQDYRQGHGFQPWSSCCQTRATWTRESFWFKGHKCWHQVRTVTRDCDRHGDRDKGHGNGRDGSQGGWNDSQGNSGNFSSGGIKRTSCIPVNFTASVSGGVFTEDKPGPLLSNNEGIQDSGFTYHISNLVNTGSTTTFTLSGDPRTSGTGVPLKTICQ